MAPVSADQLGKLYDLLVATKDGSTLPCTNRAQKTVNLSQVAYMQSTTKPSGEATEIQRKDRLIQLQAQVTDREFDAWVQIEQGNWADGLGQRVFSGQGEALGTIANKSSAYWDGEGILWPVNDYLPQRGMPLAVVTEADNLNGPSLGVQGGAQGTHNGPMYVINDLTAAKWFNVIYDGDTRLAQDITSAVTGGAGSLADWLQFQGQVWLITTNNGIWYCNQTVLTQLATYPAGTGGLAGCAAGQAGNRIYLAVNLFGGNNRQSVRLYDVTNTAGAFIGNATTDIFFDSHCNIGTTAFGGDNLYITDFNFNGYTLTQFNIPSQTTSTLATFPQIQSLFMQPIAGGVFVLAGALSQNFAAGAGWEMYLLQGTNLQDLGPLVPQVNGQLAQVLFATQMTSFGPYAIFGVGVLDSSGNNRVLIYAYDVLRGRLFKVHQSAPLSPTPFSQISGSRIGVYTNVFRSYQGSDKLIPWAVCYSLTPAGAGNGVMQEVAIGPQNLTNPPQVQQGVTIVSSLIDFTSSQNKLYRQLFAKFSPLANDPSVTVTLDVWLDQDPGNLAAVPDFTTTIAGNTSTGATTLKLSINKIAVKLVYRVTITGGTATVSGSLVPAPKLTSVAIRSGTGWSLHYFLEIARNTLCNNGQTYCFQNQDQVDEYAAHSFLKQLWRVNGGECKISLPTGETYNALIQLLDGESVKIVSSDPTSDQRIQKSLLLEVKIREDA